MTQPRKEQTIGGLKELGNRLGSTGPGKPANPGNPPPRPQPGLGQPAGYRGPQRQEGLSVQYLQTLSGGYFDERGYINEQFIVDFAVQLARDLEDNRMTRSLLRTFYTEVCDVKHLLRGGRPFEALRPRILKLQAFASNAASRRTSPAPPLFLSFITENVRVASTNADSFLDGFCEHFECVVLYFRGR